MMKYANLNLEVLKTAAILEMKKGKYTFTRPASAAEIINAAKYILLSKHLQRGQVIRDMETCKSFLQMELAECENEIFCAIFLDNSYRLLAFERLFVGSIDKTHVYLRDIVKKILQYNASAVIFAHNHPSREPIASKADIELTKNITKILSRIDVKVLDHFIISKTGVLSFTFPNNTHF